MIITYLKNLPVDYVKIDGAFVKDMIDDPIDAAMVRSINEIGHIMKKKTVAEFVESDAIIETLTEMGLVIDRVVDLEVNAGEVISRLAGRSTCQDCGGMFHEKSCPPKVSGICDGCGGVLAQRQDDNAETILKRLEVYQESTAPLKQFYKKQGNLKAVTARGSVEEIFSRVLEMVK